MKVLHFEDNEAQAKMVEVQLKKAVPDLQYECETLPYCAGPIVAIEQPDVLIADYFFKNCDLRKGLLPALQKFKGKVYVLSAEPAEKIRKRLRTICPEILDHIKIFCKTHLSELVNDIRQSYGAREALHA